MTHEMSVWAVFLASFIGAAVGAPVAVSALFFVAWKSAQKSASWVAASATTAPPQAESGLRLVKPDDEQGSAS